MCGILAAIDYGSDFNIEHFKDLNKLHYHRGPDSSEEIKIKNVYLGSSRLKIYDLSNESNQPYKDPSSRYSIIFNGAIYNFKSLKKLLIKYGYKFTTTSDTEVLLFSYIHWGTELFKHIEGMYSFCIHDALEETFFVARDPMGVKPLYFSYTRNFLIFSSEIKPILFSKDFIKEFNSDSIVDYFLFESPSHNKTFFKNIEQFPPSHYAFINSQNKEKFKPICYWDITSQNCEKNLNQDDFNEYLINSLSNAWETDVPIGLQLSGGVDSSLIAALGSEYLWSSPISTYSAIFDDSIRKYWKPRSEEKYIDQVTQKYLNLKSHKYLYSSKEISEALISSTFFSEAPIHAPSTSIYYLLAKSIKNQSKVLITGEGVDDMFNGYQNNWEFQNSNDSFLRIFIPRELTYAILNEKTSIIDSRTKNLDNFIARCKSNGYSYEEILSTITTTFGLPNLLSRHDRMFMANSIEGRPFIAEKKFFELRMQMNYSDIRDINGHGKSIFKRLLFNYFPENFVYRSKIGFSAPYGDWLSDTNYWGKYWHQLDNDFLCEYFDYRFAKEIINLPDSTTKWTGHNLNLLKSILFLNIWFKIYIKGSTPSSLSEALLKFKI